MRRFVAVFKRDKHSPPPIVTDHAHSSASSSSGSASLCLQTPDDDQHLPAAVERHASRKSWRLWLKGSIKKSHASLPDWIPPSHDVEDVPSEPSFHDEPPPDPLQSLTVLVQNSLHPRPSTPSPFSRCSDGPYVFPKSVNRATLLPRSHSLATLTLKKRLLRRLQDGRHQDGRHAFSESELHSIASLSARRITPVVPVNQLPHPFNESAPSKTTIISSSCPGLGTWISRPCFEDRYDLFIPGQDGSISRQLIVGSDLAVAALEFSEGIEAMADPDPLPQFTVDISSETVPASPSSSGHSRNSPYIPAPSPLRNEHNPPPPPSVSATQLVSPVVPTLTETDPSVKRGVRFAEDGKDDVIPLGYVLRMKKKREEKAKFLKAEQVRRLQEEERMRHEEERRKRDAERAVWEKERQSWEKEKRAMEEERRQRKYAEEVAAARLRREAQRAGGVPALKASEGSAFLGPSTNASYFPASASSSTSERNNPSTARTHFRSAYDDGGASYLPRREASEPNLPTRFSTNLAASLPITPSPRGSFMSHSPSSSPPSVNIERPPSPESSSPLPGTRPPSNHSSQELLSSSEDVKAAVAAAASRAKRHSSAVSISTSRNNSNTSLLSDRASYPVWTGSNHSLNNMVSPVPMIPSMQMQMMPMPAFAVMDMPLLPPTPPFMMQQYPRHSGSPGSPGSGSGSPRGRFGGSPNSSREGLGSQNPSRERVNVIGGAGSSGSVERGHVNEGGHHPSRSASFPRPEAHRHSTSPQRLSSGSPQRTRPQYSSSTKPVSRRTSMHVPHPQSQQRPRQTSHDLRPLPPNHAQSQPALVSRQPSAQNLQLPSPWTGLPTQSGKLPNGNSNGNGNGSRGNKAVPPRHISYSGVRSEGVRQSNMRTDPPRQAKRQTVIS
ncbi:hypothetical protein C0989_000665 [Termitomyces sp. Mn162]|nr:hypothetical protein C0989_000665 [Termitomyces sp. Mn162]